MKLFIVMVLIIALFIYELSNGNKLKLEEEYKKNKFIFTFWEPHEKIPGYLLLCIKTWKKFLPDYEIKLLDYEAAKDYIGENLFSKIVCKDMTLPIQVDAIRVALLKKFGGIWMDPDTIILGGELFKDLKEFELIMFGDEKTKTQNIGFIFASNNSFIINEWLKEIIKQVQIYKQIMIKSKENDTFKNLTRKVKIWNYLGNGIVDKLVKNITGKRFKRLNRYKINAMPEIKFFENISLNSIQRYQQFYFKKRDPEIILNSSKSR